MWPIIGHSETNNNCRHLLFYFQKKQLFSTMDHFEAPSCSFHPCAQLESFMRRSFKTFSNFKQYTHLFSIHSNWLRLLFHIDFVRCFIFSFFLLLLFLVFYRAVSLLTNIFKVDYWINYWMYFVYIYSFFVVFW